MHAGPLDAHAPIMRLCQPGWALVLSRRQRHGLRDTRFNTFGQAVT